MLVIFKRNVCDHALFLLEKGACFDRSDCTDAAVTSRNAVIWPNRLVSVQKSPPHCQRFKLDFILVEISSFYSVLPQKKSIVQDHLKIILVSRFNIKICYEYCLEEQGLTTKAWKCFHILWKYFIEHIRY